MLLWFVESQHFFQPAFGFGVVKMLADRRYNDNHILVFHLDELSIICSQDFPSSAISPSPPGSW